MHRICPSSRLPWDREWQIPGNQAQWLRAPSESPTQKVFRPTKGKPRTDFRLDCKRNTWMLWMFLDFISAIFDMLCITVSTNLKHRIQMKSDLQGLQTPLVAKLSPTKKWRRPFAHWRRCQRYSSPTWAEIWIITNITDWGKNHKIPSYLYITAHHVDKSSPWSWLESLCARIPCGAVPPTAWCAISHLLKHLKTSF